jgi:YbbR domain-containing protein
MQFIFRNWQLKLGALGLATILYTGIVFSGSFEERELTIPVETANQPDNTFLLTGGVGSVTVRYRAIAASIGGIGAEDFVAEVDLGEYDMDRAPEAQELPIAVRAIPEEVDVSCVEPCTVNVQLDLVDVRTVPVRVEVGAMPQGLTAESPEVDIGDVQVRGPRSLVRLVDRAVARVRVDASGIDVDGPVALVAVDIEGQPVEDVELTPESVAVHVAVQAIETNKTVPVRPDFGADPADGTPAPGFALESLSVEPSLVTIRGLPSVLSDVEEVLTAPLSIAGATSDQTLDAELALPPETRLADASASTTVTVTASIVPSVTSRTFITGVACTGAGSNACLPGFDQVAVTFSGPADVLSGLSAADVTVVLDVSGLPPGQHTVAAGVPGLPSGVDVVSVSPASVPVTIQAPATPAPTPAP